MTDRRRRRLLKGELLSRLKLLLLPHPEQDRRCLRCRPDPLHRRRNRLLLLHHSLPIAEMRAEMLHLTQRRFEPLVKLTEVRWGLEASSVSYEDAETAGEVPAAAAGEERGVRRPAQLERVGRVGGGVAVEDGEGDNAGVFAESEGTKGDGTGERLCGTRRRQQNEKRRKKRVKRETHRLARPPYSSRSHSAAGCLPPS